MMTDPIADMLTRIRNAMLNESPIVEMPSSKIKVGLAQVLEREGFIWDFEVVESKPHNILRISIKYGPNGERVIQHLERVSKPGLRVYVGHDDIPDVLQGLGICILSTPSGVLSTREARAKHVGGELLCKVW
jgi:small subunit ribosomal protein S8